MCQVGILVLFPLETPVHESSVCLQEKKKGILEMTACGVTAQRQILLSVPANHFTESEQFRRQMSNLQSRAVLLVNVLGGGGGVVFFSFLFNALVKNLQWINVMTSWNDQIFLCILQNEQRKNRNGITSPTSSHPTLKYVADYVALGLLSINGISKCIFNQRCKT